jgi:hypothetical protein
MRVDLNDVPDVVKKLYIPFLIERTYVHFSFSPAFGIWLGTPHVIFNLQIYNGFFADSQKPRTVSGGAISEIIACGAGSPLACGVSQIPVRSGSYSSLAAFLGDLGKSHSNQRIRPFAPSVS